MYAYEHPHPAVTTDAVIFTICDQHLKVLLIRRRHEPYKGCWAFPGGFIEPDEDLDCCVRRELREETGLTGIRLEQLHAFGDPDRDPRERVITVVYYALVPADRLQPIAADDAAAVGWFGVDELPELAFDHRQILSMAQQRLAEKGLT